MRPTPVIRGLNALEVWATGADRLCAAGKDDGSRQVCAEPGHKVRIGDPDKTRRLSSILTFSVEKGQICGSVKFHFWSPEKCGKRIEIGDPDLSIDAVKLRLAQADA
jgi:hypothetical protein